VGRNITAGKKNPSSYWERKPEKEVVVGSHNYV
jgi:hypothetical protein